MPTEQELRDLDAKLDTLLRFLWQVRQDIQRLARESNPERFDDYPPEDEKSTPASLTA